MSVVAPVLCIGLLSAPTAARAADGAAPPACRGIDGYAATFDGRRTFLWRPEALRLSRSLADRDRADPAIAALLADADAALAAGPWSVTDKSREPLSGDGHDYASMGPYWWPDPARSKTHGEPYLRRDGEINPERDGDAFDLKRMEAMSSAIEALGLAYYLTDDRRYADRAALVIRRWFLDPATLMNPDMGHAQSIPGKTPGRAEGVIDLRHLIPVVETVGLIGPSGALGIDEQTGLRDWFGRLATWMATSPIGREERAAGNNHGMFYDLLISEFSLFSGDEDVASTVVRDFPRRRIAAQFAVDGSLPRELQRTRSFHYSTWTMSAVYDLATIGECVDVDLWRAKDDEGRGLPSATAFLESYVGREHAWRWPENDMDTGDIYAALRKAAWGYRNATMSSQADRYSTDHAEARVNLTAPALPANDSGLERSIK